MAVFGLVFSVLYTPKNLSAGQLQYIEYFDLAIGAVLLIDSSLSGILFDFNEFSLIPVAAQILALGWQFLIYVLSENPFVDQYLYADILLYFAYLGFQTTYAQVSNMAKLGLS